MPRVVEDARNVCSTQHGEQSTLRVDGPLDVALSPLGIHGAESAKEAGDSGSDKSGSFGDRQGVPVILGIAQRLSEEKRVAKGRGPWPANRVFGAQVYGEEDDGYIRPQ